MGKAKSKKFNTNNINVIENTNHNAKKENFNQTNYGR